MPAAILQITSVATNLGQQMLNRWHFVDTTGAADPAPVLPAFVTDVIIPYQTAATHAITFSELIWRVITDPLTPQQSYAINPPLVGLEGGLPLPSYVAATCKWDLGATVVLSPEAPQRRIRRGGKRLGGLEDNSVAGNTISPGSKANFELIAEGYLGMAVGGWLPCVAGFPVQPPKGTDPDNPLLQVPNKYCRITGFTFRDNIGSQVSRKAGHGR